MFFRCLCFFVFLGPKWALLGPGGLPKGPGIDSVSFGPSFSPNGPIFGPLRPLSIFQFPQKPILYPNSSKSSLGPGPIGPRAPSNMGSRAHGGRRLTFRRGVGGRSPPTATRGSGGRQPPREKWTLELLPIAKSRTLFSSSSHSDESDAT